MENISSCQQHCVKEEKCQSVNLNVNKTNGYDCVLLDANKYSNSSLLVKAKNSTHLYIPVAIVFSKILTVES